MPAPTAAPPFHPELIAAVRGEAGRAADRVAGFLHGLAGRGVAVPSLAPATLLELAAALTLAEWEWAGVTAHREAGLPDARTAARSALATVLPTVRRLDPGLAVRVVGLFADRMAWHARADLGADVALDAPDEDALVGNSPDSCGTAGTPARPHREEPPMTTRPAAGAGLFYHRDSDGAADCAPSEYVAWAARRAAEMGVSFAPTPDRMAALIRRRGAVDGDLYLD